MSTSTAFSLAIPARSGRRIIAQCLLWCRGYTLQGSVMFNAKRVASVALLIAVVGSVVMVVFFAAASVSIWREHGQFRGTPDLERFALGFGVAPIPALAGVVYLWTHARATRFVDMVLRIILSSVLILAAGYCLLMAMLADFVG